MKSNKVGAYQQLNEMWYQDINQALGDFNTMKEVEEREPEYNKELEEMGGVKSIGDAGKMATPNSRPNLGRHRSSDMLDKMSKKDHKTNTVVGAKAAAYKAPHMKESEFNTVGKDLTLNDVNKDIVITPFELEKTWKDVYGEDFKTEYSGAYSYLTKNYKNFTIVDLGDVWERMYGEDFLQEYPGISRWLFSNQGKTSSKDKVVPKMNEEESEKEKAMYANTDPNITDPIDQEDNVFSKSDDANWDGRKGGDYWNRDTNWENKIPGKEINGWVAGEESQAGSIFWQNPNYPNSLIYATPGWEGVDGIAIEVHDSKDGYLDEPKLQKVVGAGTDLWKTKEGYLDLMAKVFAVVEKMLTPSKDMAEDYMGTQYGSSEDMAADMVNKGIKEDDGTGRQINHDFNDDISIDPSEFEDTISEGIQDYNHTFEEDIMDLLDDGVSKPEILTHFKDILKNANPRMEESIENEDADPFGSIKTGIDKITQGDEDDMDMSDDDRFDQLGGDKIKAGIEGLMGDGFDFREILQFVKDTIASKRNY
jgi:hypothetical protein